MCGDRDEEGVAEISSAASTMGGDGGRRGVREGPGPVVEGSSGGCQALYRHARSHASTRTSQGMAQPPVFADVGTIHSSANDSQSAVWQCPSLVAVPAQSRVCSPWFSGPATAVSSQPPQWRLFWEVQDFSSDTCSLYLEHRRSRDELAGGCERLEVDACFSFAFVQMSAVAAALRSARETCRKEQRWEHQSGSSRYFLSLRHTLGMGAGGKVADVPRATERGDETRSDEEGRGGHVCCCEHDGTCAILDAVKKVPQRHMEIAMAHRFAGDGRRAQWGVQEYLTYEDMRELGECAGGDVVDRDGFGGVGLGKGELLIEVTFHGFKKERPKVHHLVAAAASEAAGGEGEDDGATGSIISSHPLTPGYVSQRASPPPLSTPATLCSANQCQPPQLVTPMNPLDKDDNDDTGDESMSSMPLVDSPLGTEEATVQLVSESPLMLVFDHFLSAAECEQLMKLGEPDLRRSRVTDGKLSDGRTSSSTFLTGVRQDDPVVRVIEQRILTAVRSAGLIAACRGSKDRRLRAETKALMGAEPMQVVKYNKGQMYTAHYDNKQGCTRRAATFMTYLTDVDAGGATHFPKAVPLTVRECSGTAKTSGIRIWPKRGRALVFWSVVGGVEDVRSLHEAEAVLEGEKWIATKWLQLEEPSERNALLPSTAAAKSAKSAEVEA